MNVQPGQPAGSGYKSRLAAASLVALIASLGAGAGLQRADEVRPTKDEVNLARLAITHVWAEEYDGRPFYAPERAFDGAGTWMNGTLYSAWHIDPWKYNPGSLPRWVPGCRWVYLTFDRPVSIHRLVLTVGETSAGGHLLVLAQARSSAGSAEFGPLEIPRRPQSSEPADFELPVGAEAVSELVVAFVPKPRSTGYRQGPDAVVLEVEELRVLGKPPAGVDRAPVGPGKGSPGPAWFTCPVFEDTRPLGPEFVGAETADGVVRFDSPDVDWEQLARHHFQDVDLERLAPAAGKLDTGSAAYRDAIGLLQDSIDLDDNVDRAYDAPLPTELPRQPYLLTDEGIVPVRPERLEGVVRFGFDPAHTAIEGLIYYGDVLGAREDGFQRGSGFVVWSSDPPVLVSRNDQALVDIVVRERLDKERADWRERNKGPWTSQMEAKARALRQVVTSFTFRFERSDTEYVFVRWVPDEGTSENLCQGRYELTTRAKPAEILLWNYSDCVY